MKKKKASSNQEAVDAMQMLKSMGMKLALFKVDSISPFQKSRKGSFF